MTGHVSNPFNAARVQRPENNTAVLPVIPRDGSPAPHLTSLCHLTDPGNYGERSNPGNCGDNLIRDLLRSTYLCGDCRGRGSPPEIIPDRSAASDHFLASVVSFFEDDLHDSFCSESQRLAQQLELEGCPPLRIRRTIARERRITFIEVGYPCQLPMVVAWMLYGRQHS